jgi:hypothetical protein
MDSLWDKVFAYFWILMVFASIAWYIFLLVIVGYKGGVEIIHMTRRMSDRPEEPPTNLAD